MIVWQLLAVTADKASSEVPGVVATSLGGPSPPSSLLLVLLMLLTVSVFILCVAGGVRGAASDAANPPTKLVLAATCHCKPDSPNYQKNVDSPCVWCVQVLYSIPYWRAVTSHNATNYSFT